MIAKNTNLIERLNPLAKSPNLWKRCFAVATATNINHGGKQFPNQTLAICRILISDKEIMVTKAIGWALREISKKSPDLVFNFLKTNKKYISERLIKESSEKLSKKQQKDLK